MKKVIGFSSFVVAGILSLSFVFVMTSKVNAQLPPAPIIYSISPNSAPAGTRVTVTGTNFGTRYIATISPTPGQGASSGTSLQISSVSNSSFVFTVPYTYTPTYGWNGGLVTIQVMSAMSPYSASVNLSVPISNTQPYITSFIASSSVVAYGVRTTLSWVAQNASYCQGTGMGTTTLPTTFSLIVGPIMRTTSYTLTCINNISHSSTTSTVLVMVPPTIASISPVSALPGTLVTLTGSFPGVNLVTINPAPGIGNGYFNRNPSSVSTTSMTFTVPSEYVSTYGWNGGNVGISVSDVYGSQSNSVSLQIPTQLSQPTITSFTASPSPLARSQSATLSWTTTGLQSCTIDSAGNNYLQKVFGSLLGILKGANDSISVTVPSTLGILGDRTGTTGTIELGCYTGPNLTGTYVAKTVTVTIPALATTTPGLITARLDSASPTTRTVQTQPSIVTSNVPLSVYDLKSQNSPATLKGLVVSFQFTSGLPVAYPPSTYFAAFRLQSGSQSYSGTVTTRQNGAPYISFNNLNISLPADQYVPLTLSADINPAVSGVTIQTVLLTSPTSAGNLGVPAIITAVGANNSPIAVQNVGDIASSITTFISNSPRVSNASAQLGTGLSTTVNGPIDRYPVTYTFTLTAGNDPVYLGTVPAHTNSLIFRTGSGTILPSIQVLSGSNLVAGDTADALIVTSGASRTFTYQGIISSPGVTMSYNSSVVGIQYGTSPNYLNANTIISGLETLSVSVAFTAPTATPTITSFTASPSPLARSQSATLSWTTTGLQSCTIDSAGNNYLQKVFGSLLGILKGANDSISVTVPSTLGILGDRTGTTGTIELGCYTGPNLTGTYVAKTVTVTIPPAPTAAPATTTGMTSSVWDSLRQFFINSGWLSR